MSQKTTNIILGFAAGAAAGLIAGILFAPDKGSKTRHKIVKKAKKGTSKLKKNVGDKVNELKETMNSYVDDVKEKFQHLEKEAKGIGKKGEKTDPKLT